MALKCNFPVSRILIGISLLLIISVFFGVITQSQLCFNLDLIVNQKEWWRLFTSVFLFDFPSFETFLLFMAFSYYEINIESTYFAEKSLDYIVFIIYGIVGCIFYGILSESICLYNMFFIYLISYWKLKRFYRIKEFIIIVFSSFCFFNIHTAFEKGFKIKEFIEYCYIYIFLLSYFLIKDIISQKLHKNLLCFSQENNLKINDILE